MTDDGIREIHGGTPMAGTNRDPVTIRERDTTIMILQGFSERLELSPRSARFLARKLNRLALRIERRVAQAIEAGTAETEGLGPKDESATPKGCAQ